MKKILSYLLTAICSVTITLLILVIIQQRLQKKRSDIIRENVETSFLETITTRDSLISATKKQILKGSYDAYIEMYFDPLFMEREELLQYAILMANKYNRSQASYDVYYVLWNLYSDPSSLDDDTKNLAIYYLKRSIELGNYYAKHDLNKLQEAGYLDSYKSPFCD